MSSPNFEANEPLTRNPQGGDPQTPTGAKGAENAGAFFNEISGVFAKRGQKQAERELKEEREDVVEKAEEKGAAKGTKLAEEQEAPELKQKDTVFSEKFNSAQTEAWMAETQLQTKKKADELYREHKRNPQKFKEKFEEHVAGIEEELPATYIPQYRRRVKTEKQRYMSRIKNNYQRHEKSKAKASIEENYRSELEDITDISHQVSRGELGKEALNARLGDFSQMIDRQVNEGVIPPGLASEYKDRMRFRVIQGHVVGQMQQSENPQQFIQDWIKDRDNVEGKDDRIPIVLDEKLSPKERNQILSRMESTLGQQTASQNINKQFIKDNLRQEKEQLEAGISQTDEDKKQIDEWITQLMRVDPQQGLKWRNKMNEANTKNNQKKTAALYALGGGTQKMEETITSATDDKQETEKEKGERKATRVPENLGPSALEEKISVLSKKANNASGQRQEILTNKLTALQEEKNDMQAMINSGNGVGYYISRQSNLPGGSEDDLKKLGDIPTKFASIFEQDEESEQIMMRKGVIDKTFKRIKNWATISEATNIPGGPFTESESDQLRTMWDKLNAQQKATWSKVFQKGLRSNDPRVRKKTRLGLNQLAGVDKENTFYAGVASVAANSPRTGQQIYRGKAIMEETEDGKNPLAPSVSEGTMTGPDELMTEFENSVKNKTRPIFGFIEDSIMPFSSGASRGALTMPSTRKNIKEMAKAMFVNDVRSGKIQADEWGDSDVEQYVDKAAGAVETANGRLVGGVADIDGLKGRVILPAERGRAMSEQQFQQWIDTMRNDPDKGDSLLNQFSDGDYKPVVDEQKKFDPENVNQINRLIPTGFGKYKIQMIDGGFLKKSHGSGDYVLNMKPLIGTPAPEKNGSTSADKNKNIQKSMMGGFQ